MSSIIGWSFKREKFIQLKMIFFIRYRSADHTIKVWDLSEVHPTWSRVTCKMTLLGHTDTVRCLQVNGSILISGSYDNTLKIWDLESGLCKNTLYGHTDSVLCLQFDHEKIISGSADKTIKSIFLIHFI